jgi:glucosamine--fructose-6-phosphate aminotransferase (isomerizing)
VLVVGTGDLPIAAEGLPEELLPVLEIMPLQQLAWRLAIDVAAIRTARAACRR